MPRNSILANWEKGASPPLAFSALNTANSPKVAPFSIFMLEAVRPETSAALPNARCARKRELRIRQRGRGALIGLLRGRQEDRRDRVQEWCERDAGLW